MQGFLQESWQLSQERVEAPIVTEVGRNKTIHGSRREYSLPRMLHLLTILLVSAQAHKDELFLLRGYIPIVFWGIPHQKQPPHIPGTSNGTKEVKHTLPVPALRHNATQQHSQNRTHKHPGKREQHHPGSFTWWRPARPDRVHTGEGYSLEDSFQNANRYNTSVSGVGSQGRQQGQYR